MKVQETCKQVRNFRSAFVCTIFVCKNFVCKSFECKTFVCKTFVCKTFVCKTFEWKTKLNVTKKDMFDKFHFDSLTNNNNILIPETTHFINSRSNTKIFSIMVRVNCGGQIGDQCFFGLILILI